MTSRWARLARGWLTASLATFVAAVSHVAAGGPAPSPLAVVLTMAFAVILCILLGGRRVALWRQAISVTASQFLFHVLFVLGHGSATVTSAMPTHWHPGVTISFEAGDPAAASLAQAGIVMWLGHAFAAAVTVAALRYGTAAVAAALTASRFRAVRMLLATPAIPLRVRTLALPSVPSVAREDILRFSLRYRGPPAL